MAPEAPFTGVVVPENAVVLASHQQQRPAPLHAVVIELPAWQVGQMLEDSGFVTPLVPGRVVTLPAVPGYPTPSGAQVSSAEEAVTQAMFRTILVDRGHGDTARVYAWAYLV